MSTFFKIFFLVLLLSASNSFAVTTPKKEDPSKVETSTEISTTSSLGNFESKAKDYFYRTKDSLEVFRNKQAVHFASLRDQTKVKLNIQVSEDVLKRLAPMFSPPPAPEPIPGTVEGDGIKPEKIDNPMDYGTLIFATAMASLFASMLMFYGVLFLLVFIILRATVKMFR